MGVALGKNLSAYISFIGGKVVVKEFRLPVVVDLCLRDTHFC